MLNQKGLAPILIILIIAVLGIGGYFIYSNESIYRSQIVQSSPSPVDETANWKTYTNKHLNFSFEFPEQKYLLTEYNPEGKEIPMDDFPGEGARTTVSLQYCPNWTSCPFEDVFLVSIFENTQNWSLQDWLRLTKYGSITKEACELKDSRSTQNSDTYLGKEAVTFEYTLDEITDKGACKNELERNYTPGRSKNIYLKNRQQIVVLHYLNVVSERKSELDQILSTFRFN